MTKKVEVKMSFEAALKELETLVHQMEQEDLPLEDALKYFEKGVGLSAQCQKILKEAEQKIEIVQRKDDALPH